jgi:imidazolonepropionase-like amidohydrolase
MYLAGHLPLAVSALEAIEAGQRSFEHAFLFIWDCYPEMAQLRVLDNPRAVYTHEVRQRMLAQHDAQMCRALHRAMITAGAASVPTHTTRKLDAFASDEKFRSDPRLRYIPAPLQMLWLQDANGMAKRAGEGGQASYQAFYELGIRQTGIAQRAGVSVLVGTDTPDSFVFPGFSVHDELDHFVAAGISPLDALRAATLQPARFLGLSGRAGVIKAGARADLVLLNENPLQDIAAVRAINTVVLAGIPYRRAELDSMLELVEEQAGSWTMWPKFAWQALTSPIMRRQFAD